MTRLPKAEKQFRDFLEADMGLTDKIERDGIAGELYEQLRDNPTGVQTACHLAGLDLTDIWNEDSASFAGNPEDVGTRILAEVAEADSAYADAEGREDWNVPLNAADGDAAAMATVLSTLWSAQTANGTLNPSKGKPDGNTPSVAIEGDDPMIVAANKEQFAPDKASPLDLVIPVAGRFGAIYGDLISAARELKMKRCKALKLEWEDSPYFGGRLVLQRIAGGPTPNPDDLATLQQRLKSNLVMELATVVINPPVKK